IFHFPRNHVHVIPAVVSPKRRHHGRHETCYSTSGALVVRREVAESPATVREASGNDDKNYQHFDYGENQLEFPCATNADVIQSADKKGGADRDQVTVRQTVMNSSNRMGEKAERHKISQHPNDAA